MNEEKPYQPLPKEQSKIEKERTLSDADLLKGGAKYVIGERGEKENLLATKQQKSRIKLEVISSEGVEVLDLPEFVGKKLSEVEKYVLDTYGSAYIIPGDKWADLAIEKPDKAPFVFKSGDRYYCFGDRNGVWTSYIIYERGKLRKDVSSDTSTWESNRRIVLIEK